MSDLALRPRSSTELVDAAFQLLRGHYAQVVTVTAVIVAPALLMELLLPIAMQPLSSFVEQFFFPIAQGAVVLVASDVYLRRTPSASEALHGVFHRGWSLLGASIYQNLLVGLGLLLFVVPAFFFAAWTFAMPMAVVLEGYRTSEAFDRSRELARGKVRHVLVTLLVAFLIMFILAFGAMLLVGFLLGLLGAGGGRLENILSTVALIGAYPIPTTVATLLYYDLRIRKEGFDLEILARELEGAPTPARGTPSPDAAG